MDPWFAVDNDMIGELKQCSLEEVVEVIKFHEFFVKDLSGYEKIFKEIQSRYHDESDELEKYYNGEYKERIDKNEDIPFEETIDYKLSVVESTAKIALVNLLDDYFCKDLYEKNKKENKFPTIGQEEVQKREYNKFDLMNSLQSIRKQLNTFLYTIGNYQYKNHFFISFKDRKTINSAYTFWLKEMNRGNISDDDNMYTNPKYYYDVFYFDNRKDLPSNTIFMDSASTIHLVFKYLNTNIEQLVHICEIIYSSRRRDYFGVKEDIEDYINDQIKKGEMVSL